jgi:diguanylate cyclase (GGDEF)-like protein
MEAAESEFKRAKTLGSNFSLAVFDLDFFKKVNDNMGHDAGDFVLKEFAALVKNKYLRQKDIFGRLGGEEFVLYFLNTSAEDAAKLADEIRAGVELQPFIYNNQRIPVTVSIGVAEINSTIETSNALFKEADKALYKAKDNGRNQVVVAN